MIAVFPNFSKRAALYPSDVNGTPSVNVRTWGNKKSLRNEIFFYRTEVLFIDLISNLVSTAKSAQGCTLP